MSRLKVKTDRIVEDPTLPQRVSGLLEYGVDGELVLCDPMVERVHLLNTTAAALWFLCDGRRTLDGIATELAALFHRSVPSVEGDMRETLAALQGAGLLRAAPG